MLPLRDVEGQLDALQGLVGVGSRDGADVAARRQLVVIGLVERRGPLGDCAGYAGGQPHGGAGLSMGLMLGAVLHCVGCVLGVESVMTTTSN